MSGERWHGTPGGYSNHKCRCDDCRQAAREYRRQYARTHSREDYKGRYPVLEYVKRYKRKGGTGNRGKRWTGAELEFITARDADGNYLRSALTAAEALGRTVLAVERARSKCLHDPAYINHVGNAA